MLPVEDLRFKKKSEISRIFGHVNCNVSYNRHRESHEKIINLTMLRILEMPGIFIDCLGSTEGHSAQ